VKKSQIDLFNKRGFLIHRGLGDKSKAYELLYLRNGEAVVAKVTEIFDFGKGINQLEGTSSFITLEDLQKAMDIGTIKFVRGRTY
jgi:hypothetical protein